jgi:hypothetical protein
MNACFNAFGGSVNRKQSSKGNVEIVGAKYYSSAQETEGYKELIELMKKCPIPDHEILANLTTRNQDN